MEIEKKKKKFFFFVNTPPFIFSTFSRLLTWFSLSSNRFSISLLFPRSHVIFKFFAGKFTGCGKIHRPPVKHTVLPMISWSKLHRSWKHPLGTTLFCILQFEAKITSCGKIYQAPMEQVVLKLALLKSNPQVVKYSTRHLWNMLFCV